MKKIRGSVLVEIIVGSAIIALAIVGITSAFNTYLNYALSNQKNIQSAYLLEEGLEVFSFFRDQSWSNVSKLSTTTTYYLVFLESPTNHWATTTTPQYVDGQFLRSFTISDVKRDVNDDIAVSGTYDSNIKMITASIDYFQGHGTTTKSISTYISNLYNN